MVWPSRRGPHQPVLAQQRQMLRNQALPRRELFGDVADGDFALGEQAQDAQPDRIGQGFQEFAGLFGGVRQSGGVGGGRSGFRRLDGGHELTGAGGIESSFPTRGRLSIRTARNLRDSAPLYPQVEPGGIAPAFDGRSLGA